MTCLAALPDTIWAEAARHFDAPALAALLVQIALINVWNRFNVPVRQVAGRGVVPSGRARRRAAWDVVWPALQSRGSLIRVRTSAKRGSLRSVRMKGSYLR